MLTGEFEFDSGFASLPMKGDGVFTEPDVVSLVSQAFLKFLTKLLEFCRIAVGVFIRLSNRIFQALETAAFQSIFHTAD